MLRRSITVLAAVMMLATMVPATALADDLAFRARLDPGQEVATTPVVSDGTGRASFGSDGTSVDFRLSWENLTSTVVAAHIHCAPTGVNGPVGVTLVARPMDPTDQASGTFSAPDPGNSCGWVDLGDVLGALATGNAYVNVHTTMFPGGEIRGQIVTG